MLSDKMPPFLFFFDKRVENTSALLWNFQIFTNNMFMSLEFFVWYCTPVDLSTEVLLQYYNSILFKIKDIIFAKKIKKNIALSYISVQVGYITYFSFGDHVMHTQTHFGFLSVLPLYTHLSATHEQRTLLAKLSILRSVAKVILPSVIVGKLIKKSPFSTIFSRFCYSGMVMQA